MCGIVFCSSTGVPPEALEEAFAAVNPRGPDMKQTRKFKYGSSGPDYVMHFARLAIINPGKEAMQPFCSESSVLMGNGEIYNYKDISATAVSDIQAIKVLLDSGLSPAQTCQLLDGDFAFVYSSASGITVGRDPVGVAPLFCAPQENGAVAFASCARALYALGCAKVKVFPPGHYWTSAGGLQRYTSIYAGVHAQHEQYAAVPRQVRCVRIRSLLNKAIDKRLAHSDRPVAFLCSGGVDSSILVASAASRYPKLQLHAFCCAFDGDAGSQDAVFAEQLLQKLPNVTYTAVLLRKSDITKETIECVIAACETHDTVTVRAALPMYCLAKYIAANTQCKVVLSGEGADELFCGYSYFAQSRSGADASEESARLIAQLHAFDLLRADRCFAAHGLEIRVPFLDRDLLTYCLALPGDIRMPDRNGEKTLLRDAYRDVQALDKSGVLRRGKMRFSEGVGLGMVPHILKVIMGLQDEAVQTVTSPERKLQEEQRFVMRSFLNNLPQDALSLIPERTAPAWATTQQQ